LFLKRNREAESGAVPALVFTRRRDTALKLRAFQEGADDILRIPFLLSEIVARMYALMRRVHGIEVSLEPRLRLDSVEIDLIEDRLRIPGRQPISLTLTESTILYLLAANTGSTIDREDIITSIWDGVFDIESNAVDRHIRDLRIKLGDSWPASRFIETIAGKGYRWRHTSADNRPG
jgi:DNA-binding response OmpR family regulator